jgi:hypothetical protein
MEISLEIELIALSRTENSRAPAHRVFPNLDQILTHLGPTIEMIGNSSDTPVGWRMSIREWAGLSGAHN